MKVNWKQIALYVIKVIEMILVAPQVAQCRNCSNRSFEHELP